MSLKGVMGPGAVKIEESSHDLTVWKVAIETQMHFNDLLIKTRSTLISVLMAVFGAVMFALKDLKGNTAEVVIWNYHMHIGVVIISLGLGFLLAHFLIDYFYYFPLLMGAVRYTNKIDEKYRNSRMKFGLSTSITNEVSESRAHALLIVFYIIPLVIGVAAMNVLLVNTPSS